MFPQALIDQWLSKSRAGRRSVQDDPKATPAILENIRLLEAHCVEHPYEVFCASSLPRPPFSLHALCTEAEEAARLARPPALFAATEDTAGVGGRYADAEETRDATAAATGHLRRVTARLTAYLRSSNLLQSAPPPLAESDGAARVAQLVVRVVSEAALAATSRHGVAARVEAEERAANQQQQAERRLQLGLHGDGDTAASRLATSGAVGGAEADDYYVALHPIVEFRRSFQGFLSLAGLLQTTAATFAEQRGGARGSARKRTRDGDDDGEGAEAADDVAEALSTCTNSWTGLRQAGLRRLFGEHLPPMPRVAVAAEPHKSAEAAKTTTTTTTHASVPLTSAAGWAAMQLQITDRDILFAVQKVFRAGAH